MVSAEERWGLLRAIALPGGDRICENVDTSDLASTVSILGQNPMVKLAGSPLRYYH